MTIYSKIPVPHRGNLQENLTFVQNITKAFRGRNKTSLNLTMSNKDILCFENNVDPHQLPFEKAADPGSYCFPLMLESCKLTR